MSSVERNMARVRSGRVDWFTLVVVSLVAGLIWLFAESASLTRATHQGRVEIVDPAGDHVIRMLDDFDGVVRVTVEGSATATQVAPPDLVSGLLIPGAKPGLWTEGPQTFDLAGALRNDRGLRDRELSVAEVEPATIRIDVQRIIVLEDVPVAPDISSVAFDEPPAVEPAQARVRAPRPVIEWLQNLPGGPHVIARFPERQMDLLTPGAARTATATLLLPDGAPSYRATQLTPTQVQLTFTVRSLVSSTRVASAPVQALLIPRDADRYAVTVGSGLVSDLNVKGPVELIEKITIGDKRLIGVITLSTDELEQGISSKLIDVWLLKSSAGRFENVPASMEITGADAPIALTITPRRTPAETSNGS